MPSYLNCKRCNAVAVSKPPDNDAATESHHKSSSELTIPFSVTQTAADEDDMAVKVHAARLVPLNIQYDTVTVADMFEEPITAVIRKECDMAKAKIIVVYALRHPACGACREKGKELAELASQRNDLAFMTTIKDTEGLSESLIEYSTKYSQGSPIYKDVEWTMYESLGMKRLSMWDMARGITKSMIRARAKGITPNFAQVRKGDLFTRGGVFIFNQTGKLFRAIPEPEFGEALDMDAVEDAVQQCYVSLKRKQGRRKKSMKKRSPAAANSESASFSVDINNVNSLTR